MSGMFRRHLFATAALLAISCAGATAQPLVLDESMRLTARIEAHEPGATPCMIWMEEGGPKKGVLVAVHGLGLHKGCYSDFAARMVKLGWAVYAPDVRGFGEFQKMEKGARRVDFKGCLNDVQDALKFVHKEHPGMPVFLVGESMGGGIALQSASHFSDLINGVITACPASKRHHSLASATRVAGNLFTGKKSMNIRPILVDHSTKKQDLRDEWLKDADARFDLAPVELIQFQLFMDHNVAAAKKLSKPILILQGTADDLVRADAQEELVNAAEKSVPNGDAHLVYVDQAEHLLLEENQFNDGIINTVSEWLDNHRSTKNDKNI
jgi:acylglycerol lipase